MKVVIQLFDGFKQEVLSVTHEVPKLEDASKIYKRVSEHWNKNTRVYASMLVGGVDSRGNVSERLAVHVASRKKLSPRAIKRAKKFIEDVIAETLR